jgi:5,10-methylenetetrahydrofolate reductase
MTIASKVLFELNPPKLLTNDQFNLLELDSQIDKFVKRAQKLAEYVDGLHITDSVLGIPRVSSVNAATILRKSGIKTELSCSLRISDRNLITIFQFLSEAIRNNIQRVLILKGDDPCYGPRMSSLTASEVLRILTLYRFNEHIKLDLSFPSRIVNPSSFEKKLKVKPHAFVTQSISSLADLRSIVDLARPYGIKIIACILCPSEKNRISARNIGLDWSAYEKHPVHFISEAAMLSEKVLLCSPNSFNDGLDLVKELGKNNL